MRLVVAILLVVIGMYYLTKYDPYLAKVMAVLLFGIVLAIDWKKAR